MLAEHINAIQAVGEHVALVCLADPVTPLVGGYEVATGKPVDTGMKLLEGFDDFRAILTKSFE
jgi:hypothetical protein